MYVNGGVLGVENPYREWHCYLYSGKRVVVKIPLFLGEGGTLRNAYKFARGIRPQKIR